MKKAVSILIIICIVAAVFALKQSDRQNIYRLHIIANSDSESDQSVKLCVRDAVLCAERELFSGVKVENAKEARQILMENAHILYSAAQDTLRENGKDYGVKLSTGTYHFPDRVYGNALYPEGEYDALRVVLGDGKGENWWCVMFPPLCITDADNVQNSDKPTDDTVEFTSIFGEIGKWFADLFNIC